MCSTWVKKRCRERERGWSVRDLIFSIYSSFSSNSFDNLIIALEISIWLLAVESIIIFICHLSIEYSLFVSNHLNVMNIIEISDRRNYCRLFIIILAIEMEFGWPTLQFAIACHIHCGILSKHLLFCPYCAWTLDIGHAIVSMWSTNIWNTQCKNVNRKKNCKGIHLLKIHKLFVRLINSEMENYRHSIEFHRIPSQQSNIKLTRKEGIWCQWRPTTNKWWTTTRKMNKTQKNVQIKTRVWT